MDDVQATVDPLEVREAQARERAEVNALLGQVAREKRLYRTPAAPEAVDEGATLAERVARLEAQVARLQQAQAARIAHDAYQESGRRMDTYHAAQAARTRGGR
jgi:hypothetical protein